MTAYQTIPKTNGFAARMGAAAEINKVDVFLGRVKVLDLKPTNPVRHRSPLFRRQYDSMATRMPRLLGRQLPSADATYGASR